jgi:hypothetical protein
MWDSILALLAQLVAALGPAPPPAPASLDDLPVGPSPAVAYVDRGTYVDPHGRRTPLPDEHGIWSVARLGDAFLVQDARNFEGYTGLTLVGPRGRVARSWSTTSGAVVGRDGSVAWGTATTSEASVQPPPAVFLADPSGQVRRQQVPHHPHVIGVWRGRLVYQVMFGSGVWTTDVRSAPTRVHGVGSALDLDEVHGRIISRRADARTAVSDLATGRTVWQQPGVQPLRFSPSGHRVLATVRGRGLAVLAAGDGRVVAEARLPRGTRPAWPAGVVWEDRRTVLVVVTHHHRSAVVRLRAGGRVELATPPAPDDGWRPPYLLAVTP